MKHFQFPVERQAQGTDIALRVEQIRDYHHLLEILNHIFSSAPQWTDAAANVGMVGVPMCAMLDYPMGTPSGYAAFLDPEVNGTAIL